MTGQGWGGIVVAVVGEGILFTLAAAIGAATVAPIKYMWWFASATFAVLVIITLLQRIPEGSHEVCKTIKAQNDWRSPDLVS